MELTGRRTEVKRPGDGDMPPCGECEQTPTSLVIFVRSPAVTRLVSRVTETHLSRYILQLLPCTHDVEAEEGELKEKVNELLHGKCLKCGTVFDPTDKRFLDSARQHRNSPFCRACVDQCHDSEIADHVCFIDRHYHPEVYR